MKPTSSGTCNFLATCFSKFSNFSATLKIKYQLFWQLLDTFIGNFLGNLSFGYLWLSLLLLAPEGLETSSISVWAGITNSNGSVRPFFTRILFAVFLLNKNILRLEDLVVEITTRYPNVKGCSLRGVHSRQPLRRYFRLLHSSFHPSLCFTRVKNIKVSSSAMFLCQINSNTMRYVRHKLY